MENKNGYLYVKGNVNIFCPHCGKVLWEEMPYGTKCSKCGGEIDLSDSNRKTVDIDYIRNL